MRESVKKLLDSESLDDNRLGLELINKEEFLIYKKKRQTHAATSYLYIIVDGILYFHIKGLIRPSQYPDWELAKLKRKVPVELIKTM